MGLMLTGTFDQALLATVIAEASKAGRQSVGRTTIQKLMYFLQVSGVPMKYRFDIHHYGPYCDEVTRDTEWLCADEVIEDSSSNPNYSNYIPGPQFKAIITSHRRALAAVLPRIRKVVVSLSSLALKELELTATIHYLYRQIRAVKARGPWQRTVVDNFMTVKGDRFKREEVLKAYEEMRDAGLVEA